MSEREQAATLPGVYMDLLRIAKADNKETEINNQLREAKAKLEVLGVPVESLIIE